MKTGAHYGRGTASACAANGSGDFVARWAGIHEDQTWWPNEIEGTAFSSAS
jgi:hypothetical protein